MLDALSTSASPFYEHGLVPVAEPPILGFSNLVPPLKRSIWQIAATVLITTAIGAVYVALTPARYVASAQILIEPQKQALAWQGSDSGTLDLTIDTAQIESQVEILKSQRIARTVLSANDPEFHPDNKTAPEEQQQNLILSRFMENLNARRVGQTYIIEVSFTSKDPQKAANISNAVAQAYMADQLAAKTDAARQASRWMEERLTQLGEQLNAAARAVQHFKAEAGILGGESGSGQLIDKLTELEARADTYRKLYENTLQRLVENQEQESFPVFNARVIASATPPVGKSYPKTTLVLLFSMLSGAFISLGIVYLRHASDRSLRSEKQARQEFGVDFLGTLPRYRSPHDLGPDARHDEAVDAPRSPYSDALRRLKLSLELRAGSVAPRCIGVLALQPHEGASTFSMSLAATYQQADCKTLMIDADFRGRGLTRRIAPTAEHGLVDLLTAATHDVPNDGIILDRKTSVGFLPAGSTKEILNSAELLRSSVMRDLLAKITTTFTPVIVDLPALSGVIDARAVAPLLDGCILVVEWGRTPIDAVKDALNLLRASNATVYGIVLNGVDEGIPPLPDIDLVRKRLVGGLRSWRLANRLAFNFMMHR